MINKKPDLLIKKFHARWLGPLEVTKRCSDLVYEIVNRVTQKSKRVHFNLLKAAQRNKAENTVAVAGADEESSEEEIISPGEYSTPMPRELTQGRLVRERPNRGRPPERRTGRRQKTHAYLTRRRLAPRLLKCPPPLQRLLGHKRLLHKQQYQETRYSKS